MRYVNESMIESNLSNILKNNEVMWVIKDDAYSFGIERMLYIAIKLGIKHFAVKSIDEGILIRNKYYDSEILVLGKTKDIKRLKAYNLIGTINDYDEYLRYKELNVRAHLAIDVGMNRFGMKRGYLAIINDKIIEAIYTHIYEENEALDKINLIENLANNYGKKYHIGGSIAYGKTKGMIRIGRIIYENSTKFFGNIVNIKKVVVGETVGYDSSYCVKKDCMIGICDIGYVNGLSLFYNGKVSINNKFYDVIGRCCMDQCFIIIDNLVSIGDCVEFYGENISEDEFIIKNNMTKYELFLQMH